MTTFNEITNPTKYVRVLRDTRSEPPRKWLIGEECEVAIEIYNKKGEVSVEYKGVRYYFNRTDVAFLTPIEFKGKKIAIGDWVKIHDECPKHLVLGYSWMEEWVLDVAEDGDLDCCKAFSQDFIISHRRQEDEEDDQKMTDEDLIAELKRRGRIKNGEIID